MDNSNCDEHEAEELFQMSWLSCPAASGVFLPLYCHLMEAWRNESIHRAQAAQKWFNRRHGGTEIITQRARSHCALLNLPCTVNRQFLQDKSTGNIVLLTYYSGLTIRIITKTGYAIRRENNLNLALRPQALHASSSPSKQGGLTHTGLVCCHLPTVLVGSFEQDWTKQGLSLCTSQREGWAGTQQAASTSTASQESVKAKNSKRSPFYEIILTEMRLYRELEKGLLKEWGQGETTTCVIKLRQHKNSADSLQEPKVYSHPFL